MDKHITFPKLDDDRHLYTVIRAVPDGWSRISGYLISPDVPQTAMATTLNCLQIDDNAISLRRADRPPELFKLFVCKQDIDKVVFECSRPGLAAVCRELASGLVEIGFQGIISFSKESKNKVRQAGFNLRRPAELILGCSDFRPIEEIEEFSSILTACSRL